MCYRVEVHNFGRILVVRGLGRGKMVYEEFVTGRAEQYARAWELARYYHAGEPFWFRI